MDNPTANAMLAVVLAAAIGVVMAGHIADRIFLPQIAQCNTRQAESAKYIRLLETKERELYTIIAVFKAREDAIAEETLEAIGMGDHYKIVKNKSKGVTVP